MTPALRRVAVCAAVIVVTALAHESLVARIASTDPVAELLSGQSIATFQNAAALGLLRAFLMLLAPGWVLYSLLLLGHGYCVHRQAKARPPSS